MDLKELEKLVALVENAGISHLSIDENGTKIEIKKEPSPSYQMTLPHNHRLQYKRLHLYLRRLFLVILLRQKMKT